MFEIYSGIIADTKIFTDVIKSDKIDLNWVFSVQFWNKSVFTVCKNVILPIIYKTLDLNYEW